MRLKTVADGCRAIAWFLGSAACAGILCATLAWAQAAKFPSQLFTYVEPDGLIHKSDFSALGREVQAIEAFLGVNGSNLAQQEHCVPIENPIAGEILATTWQGPSDLTIQRLFCKVAPFKRCAAGPNATTVCFDDSTCPASTCVASGTSSVAADLQVDDGSPAAVNGAPLACTPAGTLTTTMNGDTTMAANDLVNVAISAVTGNCIAGANTGAPCTTESECPLSNCSVRSLSFCFVVAKQ